MSGMIPFPVLATLAGLFFGFILAEVFVREAMERGWEPPLSLKRNRAVRALRAWPLAFVLAGAIGGFAVSVTSHALWAVPIPPLGAAALISGMLLLKDLRDRHPERWSELGRPDPYRGSGDPRLHKFVWRGGYRDVPDDRVRRLAVATRLSYLAFSVSLLIFVVHEALE